jgi:uncharacterized protein GlcG (DUF336 family)
METAELSKYSQPGGPFYGIHVSNGGRVMILAGGIPLRHRGQIIGAIGVSGGSDVEDLVCFGRSKDFGAAYCLGSSIWAQSKVTPPPKCGRRLPRMQLRNAYLPFGDFGIRSSNAKSSS